MKNPNIKLVAIVPSLDGGCQYVGLVKNITNEEYATLLKEQRTNEQKQAKEKRELLERVKTLESELTTLKHEIKVLKGEDEDEESIED
jgi:hypothetical protein